MIVADIDKKADELKKKIMALQDQEPLSGAVYYVSAAGNDANDGLSPNTPWKTLKKVSEFDFPANSTVRFRRGDTFRGFIKTRQSVKYCAYGEGEKPKLYGWEKNLADAKLWNLYDTDKNIWKLTEKILDCGTLVFNEGEKHSRKLIPSFRGGRFVCRYDEEREFHVSDEMTEDLDIFCNHDLTLTEKPSKGEDFGIPALSWDTLGELYLRCDAGNPGEVFNSIEALTRRHMFFVGNNENVTIENLCIKYVGTHAISASSTRGLNVTGCEIGWIGGAIQNYFGTDPNYPEGRRGSVTRFGNGVEIYGSCDNYMVNNCYIYQVYDAAITHQITTNGKRHELKNIKYTANLVENCVYSIEYFLDQNKGEDGSIIENCEIADNILRLSGYGWGQQRHNKHTPAHIKGWSYTNPARNFIIRDNVFDRGAYRLIHTVAKKKVSCPKMSGNIYIQAPGKSLGLYGTNETELIFDENAEDTIKKLMGDHSAVVCYNK
jgi:hypothetical protein